jgi:hydroxylamine reductase (hybrid-cluster protein)
MIKSIKQWLGFSAAETSTTPTVETPSNMFCYQCEQAANGGCSKVGVCGKGPDVAALQDQLVYTLKGIAFWADNARSWKQYQVATTDIDLKMIKLREEQYETAEALSEQVMADVFRISAYRAEFQREAVIVPWAEI